MLEQIKENEKLAAESKKPWYDKYIIGADNKIKQVFDAAVLLLVGYSCITTVYAVSFVSDQSFTMIVIGYLVDALFFIDMVLSFLHAKIDEHTRQETRDIKDIAIIYLTSWFIVDFVSIFPFGLIIGEDGLSAKLLRLFRMPRMIKLLDKKRIKNILTGMNSYKQMSTDGIVKDFLFMYTYEVIRLIIMATILVYFVGSFTYLVSDKFNSIEEDDSHYSTSFIQEFNFEKYTSFEKLIVSGYFSLTMLSTVGYGDLYPVSKNEMIYCIMVMMCGVAFFSYIMGTLFDIMTTYKEKTGPPDLSDDLQKWILTIQRFNPRLDS